MCVYDQQIFAARLAQSVERQTLNLVVVGSSPTVGVHGRFYSSVGRACA